MQTLKGKWIALSLASVCAVGVAAAETGSLPLAQVAAAPTFLDWVAVDSTVLEQMRGGFDLAPGLRVSFGIERLVNLNGVLQTATRIEVPDAGKLLQPPSASTGLAGPSAVDAGAPTLAAGVATGATALIQNGLGNMFSPAALPQSAVGTFIQNSVNNQTIQSLTIINASTNSLELLKSANLQATLFEALTQPAGLR